MDDYVELHASSAFSFQRGASSPADLVAAAVDRGLPALALCDDRGVYGIPRFHQAAVQAGIRPIVGAGLPLREGGLLPVLVASAQGYRNLCQLLTRAHRRSPKGQCMLELAEIPPYAGGLVAMTGDAQQGLFAQIPEPDWPARLQHLRAAFPGPGQLYVELNHWLTRPGYRYRRALADLARAHGLPLLATNAVTHATCQQHPIVDALTCLRQHTTLDAVGWQISPNAEAYLKSPAAMAHLFRDYPEAVLNTRRVAEQIEFSLEDPGYRFPAYPVPAGHTMHTLLRQQAYAGARQRYRRITREVRHQLDHELGVIKRLGFSGYFLIVWDIVEFCRRQGILVQGRGSAANSTVCYCLQITAVDPLACRLLFERFLSEGRAGWPDIDLDLPSGPDRERVIQEVYRRYGPQGAAMTANVITYGGRSAIRDAGKILGLPLALMDRLSKLCGPGALPDPETLRLRLQQAEIPPGHPRLPAFRRLVRLLNGLPRHLGQHSGGMILAAGSLAAVVPLENATMPGRVVAQWDKDDCESLGMIKVDLLGLGMMAALQEAVALTCERGHPVDLAHLPKDDPATFDCMCRADTIGVFQIESRAQQATLPRMRPACFYDVAIEVAIIRPGPIQGDLVHPYLARRQGKEPIDYIDDALRPVLERTLGVPLFQEQMLRIAMIMADFSPTEADQLRRALNFHRSPERLESIREKMRRAMETKGVEPAKITRILQATGSFALYGFPESHAISFALLAYASTYLKVHYPAEFYCALLNNQPMGFYSPATLVQDAKRHGLRFLPPCINASDFSCTIVDDQQIRFGLSWIRGVANNRWQALLSHRQQHGPCRNVGEFLNQSIFHRDELRRIARSGALNALAGDRRSALWAVAGGPRDDLFASHPDDQDPPSPLLPLSYPERLQADYATVGLTVGSHPMHLYRRRHPHLLRAGDLPRCRHGQTVSVGGSVISRQRPATAKGFVFLTLEDETGIANVIIEPELFEQNRPLLTGANFLAVSGPLQNQSGVIHVRAARLRPILA